VELQKHISFSKEKKKPSNFKVLVILKVKHSLHTLIVSLHTCLFFFVPFSFIFPGVVIDQIEKELVESWLLTLLCDLAKTLPLSQTQFLQT
jgi:hypothetical protein